MHESGKYLSKSDEVIPEENRVFCPVPKGGVLLLTNKIIHGCLLNKTNGVRWSMDLR